MIEVTDHRIVVQRTQSNRWLTRLIDTVCDLPQAASGDFFHDGFSFLASVDYRARMRFVFRPKEKEHLPISLSSKTDGKWDSEWEFSLRNPRKIQHSGIRPEIRG